MNFLMLLWPNLCERLSNLFQPISYEHGTYHIRSDETTYDNVFTINNHSSVQVELQSISDFSSSGYPELQGWIESSLPIYIPGGKSARIKFAISANNASAGDYHFSGTLNFYRAGRHFYTLDIDLPIVVGCDALCTGVSFQDKYDSLIQNWVNYAIDHWGLPDSYTYMGVSIPAGFCFKGQIMVESGFDQNACSCNGWCKFIDANWGPACPTGCFGNSEKCCPSPYGSQAQDVGLMQIDSGSCTQNVLQTLNLTGWDIKQSASDNLEAGIYIMASLINSCGDWYKALGEYNWGPQKCDCCTDNPYSANCLNYALKFLQEHEQKCPCD